MFIMVCLLLIIISGTVNAFQVVELDSKSNELTLDFKGSRIRVETWQNDYLKIEPTYLVQEEYSISKNGEVISFDKREHLQKYPDDLENNEIFFIPNEVFFIIKVPQNTILSIQAESVNAKNGCLLKEITARYVRVREATFLKEFKGKGEKIYIRDSHFLNEKHFDFKKVIIDNHKIKRVLRWIF